MFLHGLLARGYFPKELPNPFVTESFANLIVQSRSLPGYFGVVIPETSKNFPKFSELPSSKLCRYSYASRGGFLRRQLSIPNPIHYYLLCNEVVKGWDTLRQIVCVNKFSATTPIFSSVGRALQGREHLNRRGRARQTRLNNRYILKTDISRFYPSIYTHTLPWAIHKKSEAKKNRSPQLLGNRLDYLIRMAQDGQTVGVPIGTDVSFLLGELLMHRCDEELVSKLPNIQGHRVIDDYELGFRDRSAAESAFHLIEASVREFELALNPKKSEILALPQPLESLGVSALQAFPFRTGVREEATDLQFYFDQAFELHQRNTEEGILNYAVGRLDKERKQIHHENWPLFEKLLFLCIGPEPACLRYVLGRIISQSNEEGGIDRAGLSGILNALIAECTPLGHSNEVAWALWGCLALNLSLDSAAIKALEVCEDSVVVLLALHCEQNGLAAEPFDKTEWEKLMTAESLYNEHWLLAYEANVKGWLRNTGQRDFVLADESFQFLKTNGVSFYDVRQATPATKGGQAPLPNPLTGSLITFDGYGL